MPARQPVSQDNVTNHPALVEIRSRLDNHAREIVEIKAGLAENTAMTRDMHQWLSALRIFTKVVAWVASVGAGLIMIKNVLIGNIPPK